jgi:F-type H+-transporting ATPase subunit b
VGSIHRGIARATVTGLALALGVALDAAASEGDLVILPQIPKMLSLMLLFALLVWPVHALLFRPIFRTLDARQKKIEGPRRRAEQLSAETERVLASYQASIRAAREQAERERKGRLEEARAENAAETARARELAEREIQRARADVGQALAQARAQLRAQAERLAEEAAARVLGRPVA